MQLTLAISIYNAEKYIIETLESVMAQAMHDFHLLIVMTGVFYCNIEAKQMTKEQFIEVCKKGENTSVEYKTCKTEVSHSVYESVCSMLNRNGGCILMGVSDDGEILGVAPSNVSNMTKAIMDTINNPEVFLPCPFFIPEIITVEGKICIVINIHCGQYVYRYKGRYYDRFEAADYDITDSPELLQSLFERKNPHLFEDRNVEGMTLDDIDSETLLDCRKIWAVALATFSSMPQSTTLITK